MSSGVKQPVDEKEKDMKGNPILGCILVIVLLCSFSCCILSLVYGAGGTTGWPAFLPDPERFPPIVKTISGVLLIVLLILAPSIIIPPMWDRSHYPK